MESNLKTKIENRKNQNLRNNEITNKVSIKELISLDTRNIIRINLDLENSILQKYNIEIIISMIYSVQKEGLRINNTGESKIIFKF